MEVAAIFLVQFRYSPLMLALLPVWVPDALSADLVTQVKTMQQHGADRKSGLYKLTSALLPDCAGEKHASTDIAYCTLQNSCVKEIHKSHQQG